MFCITSTNTAQPQGSAKATSLPNLKAYAKYRSKQLVTNFSHDAADESAAANALKYGKHIQEEETRWDPVTQTVIKTGNMIDSYVAGCGEAIGYTNYYFQSDTIDDVAKRLADGVRDSAGHWRYVGHSSNIYIS